MPKHLIYLPKRNPNLSIDEFITAWKEHSQLGKTCPNVKKFITNAKQCARIGYPRSENISEAYDGAAILTLSEGTQSAQIWDDPEVLAIMKPDELRVFNDYVKNFTLETTSIFKKYSSDQTHSHCLIHLLSINGYQLSDQINQELSSLLKHQSKSDGPDIIKQEIVHAVTHQPSDLYSYDIVVETWFDSKEDALLFVNKKNLSASSILAERFAIKKEIKLLLTVTHNRT